MTRPDLLAELEGWALVGRTTAVGDGAAIRKDAGSQDSKNLRKGSEFLTPVPQQYGGVRP